MFGGGSTNPYDDIVVKATDENLTSENWEIILNLCDKVTDEGEHGARNVIAALMKRLTHRNANVQLYSLALVESLTKNCGKELHSEVASRAFTQALERLITDRTTHDKVRRKALGLIGMWTAEFENDPTLGIMEECYESLRAKNYKFDAPDEPPPPEVDDEVRRREEEELQRALEISVSDKGGRAHWGQYSLASSSGAGGSGSHNGYQASSSSSGPSGGSSQARAEPARQASYSGGYAPSATPSYTATTSTPSYTATATTPAAAITQSTPSMQTPASPAPSITSTIVTRVRALHTFEPTEPGELAFDKGDVIKVVDRGYKDWWRGQLRGRTGIFPVNYVEPLPEPTAAELAAEAQQEAHVFAQATNVDRLLTMLRSMDPAKDNLADNDEIQELYRSSMALRPKIVKLIDKYSQKRADLVAMNESFVKARTIFDRMMEDSLARHAGYFDQRPPYMLSQSSYQPRPDSRATQGYGPQALGWNPSVYEQPGYNAYPAPAAGYTNGSDGQYTMPPVQQQLPSYHAQQQRPQPQSAPNSAGYAQPYPGQDRRMSYMPQQQGQPEQQPQAQPQYQGQGHPDMAGQPQQQSPVPMHQQSQVQPQPQPQPQQQPQHQAQSQLQHQPQQQPQTQPMQQESAQPDTMQGPPFVYDPNAQYPDANVQAWAQYYAHGGTDPTGSVYFLSVPGITSPSPAAQSPQPQAQQPQAQPEPAQVQSETQQQQPQFQQQSYGEYRQPGQPALQRHSSVDLPSSTSSVNIAVTSPSISSAPHTQTAFVQAIQQQQQQLQRQSSLPNPPSPTRTTQAQLPPADSVLYGQSPYGAGVPGHGHAQGQGQGQAEGWQGGVQGLAGQMAGVHVGEPTSPGVGA